MPGLRVFNIDSDEQRLGTHGSYFCKDGNAPNSCGASAEE
jgi:hypothetical protein